MLSEDSLHPKTAHLFILCLILSAALPGSARNRHHDRLLDRIRGEMEFMASDAMQGRGSGTHDELVTAVYLASELRAMGVAPMGDNGGYLQNVSGEFNFYREGKKQWNTRNIIGVIPGRDPKLKDQVVLLTAHMDHIGIRKPVNGDDIYNGADDDASGCIAVLQLARILAHGKSPRHTVIFAFFGSEETGGQGDQYFLEHPQHHRRDPRTRSQTQRSGGAADRAHGPHRHP